MNDEILNHPFLNVRCAVTTGYELLFKIQKCEIIGYLIGIGNEKQVIHGYQLNKIHIEDH